MISVKIVLLEWHNHSVGDWMISEEIVLTDLVLS